MTVRVGLDFGVTEGCCGVTQVTSFSSPDYTYGELTATGANAEEAYKNLFDALMSCDLEELQGGDFDCAVLQIWFFKGHDYNKKDNAEYEAEPFRRLIEQIPNVVNLGEHRNPNSGNLIQGYQWSKV
jgi:hypothetical protein